MVFNSLLDAVYHENHHKITLEPIGSTMSDSHLNREPDLSLIKLNMTNCDKCRPFVSLWLRRVYTVCMRRLLWGFFGESFPFLQSMARKVIRLPVRKHLKEPVRGFPRLTLVDIM